MNEKHALEPKPYWSPYTAGALLGVTLYFAFLLSGRGLGGSGALNRIVAFWYEVFNEELAHGFAYYQSYFQVDSFILYDYSLFQVIGVLVGGYISASFGRRSHIKVEKGPNISVRNRLVFAFVGGALMAIGARIARGCTSGQILTGGATLAVGSWVMMAFFFGGAYLFAYFIRKQWN